MAEKLAQIALARDVDSSWLAYGDCDNAPDSLNATRWGLVP